MVVGSDNIWIAMKLPYDTKTAWLSHEWLAMPKDRKRTANVQIKKAAIGSLSHQSL